MSLGFRPPGPSPLRRGRPPPPPPLPPLLSPSGAGGRDDFSTPQAMYTSPSPTFTALAAAVIDCSDDAQNRCTVWPGTAWGKPASRPAVRAMLNPVSPD